MAKSRICITWKLLSKLILQRMGINPAKIRHNALLDGTGENLKRSKLNPHMIEHFQKELNQSIVHHKIF